MKSAEASSASFLLMRSGEKSRGSSEIVQTPGNNSISDSKNPRTVA
jgi:hypothetical protein